MSEAARLRDVEEAFEKLRDEMVQLCVAQFKLKDRLRAVEAALAAMTRERDAYKRVVDAVIANGTAAGVMLLLHRRLSKDERSEFWTEYHGRIADALEALPEATP